MSVLLIYLYTNMRSYSTFYKSLLVYVKSLYAKHYCETFAPYSKLFKADFLELFKQ